MSLRSGPTAPPRPASLRALPLRGARVGAGPTAPPDRGRSDPAAVTADDLSRLSVVHDLLHQLGRPDAALPRLVPLCEAIPPLAARLVDRARRGAFSRGEIDVRRALSLLGNQGLEDVLLGVLEDLTVLKSELEDEAG